MEEKVIGNNTLAMFDDQIIISNIVDGTYTHLTYEEFFDIYNVVSDYYEAKNGI